MHVRHVLVLHAYSPGNSGDGLLVDLAVEHVRQVAPNAFVDVVAADAAAFEAISDRPNLRFHQWGASDFIGERFGRKASMGLAAVGAIPKRIRQLAERADLIVAVGGGYMRGGTAIEALKSYSVHATQLRLAAKHGRKTVYLPQSIGPFRGLYRSLVRRRLTKLHTVFVRDDLSLNELSDIPSIVRLPDLAVLDLGSAIPATAAPITGKPIFVARALSRPRGYSELLDAVRESDMFEWAVQSTSSGNNDLPLIARYVAGDPLPLSAYLTDSPRRIVVSTRLHGSMAALIAGHPTIHLSYERKGWGAFEDMGLNQFVLNARDVTLSTVLQLAETIAQNPAAYWAAVDAARPRLRAANDLLRKALNAAAASEPSDSGRT